MNRCFSSLRAFWLVALLLFVSVPAVWAEDAGQGSDPELVRAIDQILAVPGLQTGFQGILIQSLSDGVTLYERNADHVFLPASNNKLLTSGAALALLGKDFTYHTKLFRTGTLDSVGTLHGDLILQGAGDPILMPDDLLVLARQAYIAGIRRIQGDVRYDDSRFDHLWLGYSWEWDDEPFDYSAQISALNLNENVVAVQPQPGRKVGDPIRITVSPTDRYTTVVNKAVTGPSKSKASLVIDRKRGQNVIAVSGSLPIDAAAKDNPSVPVTIEEPSRFTTTVLAEDLSKVGIRVHGQAREGSPVPAEATLVAEHVSPPLTVILQKLNKPSDNLIAECLLKTIGAVQKGKGTGGEGGTGAQAARVWLAQIGLDVSRLQQADGSGLSRVNYVSPRNLVRLLIALHGRTDFPVFYDSLPIAGIDGTLRNRLKGTRAANNCHAKTGTMSHVSSLSGYITTREGETLVFSILMNGHLTGNRVCSTAQDAIVVLLADYTRKKGTP